MSYELPTACPVCQNNLRVTGLSCSRCGTTVQGDFDAGAFARLTSAQRQFVVSFLKCRGNIREMEKEFAISYPTVRSRIDEILAALGERPSSAEDDNGADAYGSWAAPAFAGAPGKSDASGNAGAQGETNAHSGQSASAETRTPPSPSPSQPAAPETSAASAPPSRRAILEMLSRGEIDAAAAQKMIEAL